MALPRVYTDGHIFSYEAVALENSSLRVLVIPELGGRIWSIRYKPFGKELLWHSPRVRPQKAAVDACFDDVWCGGWEEMFPTAAPGVINGKEFPDHGEVWNQPWTPAVERALDSVTLRLVCRAPFSGISIEKRITIHGNDSRFNVSYVFLNPTESIFPFLFGLHAALAVSPSHRIAFPPMAIELDRSFPGTLEGVNSPFMWPFLVRQGKAVDLRRVTPRSAGEVYFLYGNSLQEGWCAVTDTDLNLSYGLVFSTDLFRSCWLFASYGGWRDYNVAVLEPCTSYPQQIDEVLQNKRAAALAPHGTLRTQVVFQVQEHLSCIRGLTADGKFR